MDEAVRRIGAGAERVAGDVPHPDRRPVVRRRHVDDRRVAVDAPAVQPVGVIGDDHPVAHHLGDHRRHLALDLSDEGVPVVGNATELEQVFVNLIRNAIEASPKDTTIVIESYRAGGRAYATLTDRGRGIPEADQPRIFDPFFTTRAHEGGTGLGLSICHGILEAHAGSVEVASEPGTGTTVSVSLPCPAAEESDAQS